MRSQLGFLAFLISIISALLGIWMHSSEWGLTAGLFLAVAGFLVIADEDFI